MLLMKNFFKGIAAGTVVALLVLAVQSCGGNKESASGQTVEQSQVITDSKELVAAEDALATVGLTFSEQLSESTVQVTLHTDQASEASNTEKLELLNKYVRIAKAYLTKYSGEFTLVDERGKRTQRTLKENVKGSIKARINTCEQKIKQLQVNYIPEQELKTRN